MRERVEALVGGRARAMWVMTFHSACARILRADAERLGYTRGFTIYDEQDSLRLVKNCVEELDVDPKRFPPRGIRRQISDAKNELLDAEALPAQGRQLLRADRRRRLRPLRAAPARGQRDGLRRPAVPLREPVRALRGGPRPLPARVPPRARRRVPGHQPRPVPLAPAARPRSTATSAWSATTTSRSTASAAPTSATSSTSRTTSPTPTVVKLEQNYRSTQTILDAANAVISNNRAPQGQDALDRARRGRPGPRARARGRARRGALRGRGDRAARGRGRLARRHRHLLPDQRAVPRARGHARALRRRPTR